MFYVALGLFLVTYVLLMIFGKYRSYIALASAAIFVVVGILPIGMVLGAIDWNVLLMIAGTMGTVALFIESKMPALIADEILGRVPNVKWAIVSLALFAGIISAFVDNVATVLMVAPVALEISKRIKISPVPVVIAIAVSSNLQGAATLVGDTTSIMLGGYANMNFMDFFWYQNRPGMFFVVQTGAILSLFFLLAYFRKYKQPVSVLEKTKVTNYLPTALLLGTIVLLIVASFVPNKPSITNGIICVVLFALGLVIEFFQNRDFPKIRQYFKEIDLQILLLLAGLFVIIAGISQAGIIDAIAKIFVQAGGDNVFVIYTLVVWVSVLISAFIDNIPYVATMLPVVSDVAARIGAPAYLLYFGLLCGATLGGNMTPIGASANITGIGILHKAGYKVSTKEFMQIGIPFTLIAVVAGYVMIWLFWA